MNVARRSISVELMKVLFDHQLPFALAHGGFERQLLQTKSALEQAGVETDFVRWWDAAQRGNIIHFVNEDLQLATEDDLKEIKNYLAFSRYGHSRLPIGLPLSETTRDYFGKWSHSLQQYQ